jgi:hypothetical protein
MRPLIYTSSETIRANGLACACTLTKTSRFALNHQVCVNRHARFLPAHTQVKETAVEPVPAQAQYIMALSRVCCHADVMPTGRECMLQAQLRGG